MPRTNWRDECKEAQQAFMVARDEYSEVAAALGFDCDTWFGEPRATHAEVVARAKQLAAKVTQ